MPEQQNVRKKYDELVRFHKVSQQEKRKKIFEELPALSELFTCRNQVWISGLKDGKSDVEIQQQLLVIDQKINDILNQKDYDRSMLEYRPICSVCDDHGYINGKMCQCYKQLWIDQIYKQSNLEAILQKENFSTFDETVFDENHSANGRSARDNIVQIKKRCELYIDRFEEVKQNLLFVGAVGTGKTFLAHCIAKSLIDRGKTVIYFTAYDLIERYTDLMLGNIDKNSLALIENADLVIIDDLGCERQTEFAQNSMFHLINERLLTEKRMLISTNLSANELRETYNERIFSRLMGSFLGLRFLGGDLRISNRKI